MPEEEIDLLRYYEILRKRKWLFIQVTIVITLIVAISSIYSRSYYPTYESRVELLLSNPASSSGSSVSSFVSSLFNKDSVDLETQMQIIKSPLIAEMVAKNLNMDATSVNGKINTEVVPNTSVIAIKAQDKNPSTARKIANATAKAYLSWTNMQNIQSIQGQQRAIGKIISQTETKIMALMKSSASSKSIRQILDNPAIVTTLYGNLVQRYADLEISALTSNTNMKIINSADTPSQLGTSVTRSTLAGFIFSLIVAFVLVFALEYKDSLLKKERDRIHPIS